VSVWWRPLGCVLWLDFAEPDGPRAYDQSGQGNHGTIYGASRRRGPLPRALRFDGVEDYVEVADDPSLNFDLPESFSLEAWFKLSSLPTTSWYAILSKYGAGQGAGYNDLFALYIDTDGKIRFSVRDSAGNNPVVIGSTLTIDTWYHVVGVYDGSRVKLYEDSVLVNEAAAPPPPINTTANDLWIGNVIARTYWLNGVIALARVYGRALTGREVWAHYRYLKYAVLEAP